MRFERLVGRNLHPASSIYNELPSVVSFCPPQYSDCNLTVTATSYVAYSRYFRAACGILNERTTKSAVRCPTQQTEAYAADCLLIEILSEAPDGRKRTRKCGSEAPVSGRIA